MSTDHICSLCSKNVGLKDRRTACKKTWHEDCFVCGGSKRDGCAKKLTLDAYTANEDQPYCRTCYGKLYGPKGYIGGSTMMSTPAGTVTNFKNDRDYKVTDGDAYLQETKAKREQYLGQDSETAVTETFVPTVHYNEDFLCAKCFKPVGFNDRRAACKRTWHSDCFTCGGTEFDGCNKKLNLDNFTSHYNEPYCKACYSKVYKTVKKKAAPKPAVVAAPVVEQTPSYGAAAVEDPSASYEAAFNDEGSTSASTYDYSSYTEPAPVAEDPAVGVINNAMQQEYLDGTKPLDTLNLSEIEKLLANLNLTEYNSQFQDNEISGKILAELSTEEELAECEISMPSAVTSAFIRYINKAKDEGVSKTLLW